MAFKNICFSWTTLKGPGFLIFSIIVVIVLKYKIEEISSFLGAEYFAMHVLDQVGLKVETVNMLEREKD